MLLKVCGMMRVEDAVVAVTHGATAVGLVFWPNSPRCVGAAAAAEIVKALPPEVTPVGVFVNPSVDMVRRTVERVGLAAVQLHGNEKPVEAEGFEWPVFRAVTLETARSARTAWPEGTVLVLDADDPVRRGGTGRTVDWRSAAVIAREGRVVLAGGLTPENVAEAVAVARPFGVDVSSGVEDWPGVKSPEKMARFLRNARRAFEETVSR
jgi:phosphoribosylanthranilate isomerase